MQFVPGLLSAPCKPSHGYRMTTLASDWNDIEAVVDHVRAIRHVDRVSLIGWSLGGPRAGGFTAAHRDRVSKLVLLAPAYRRQTTASSALQTVADGPAMAVQTLADFSANWDRQLGCSDQYDANVRKVVWSQMLESDPVSATWGPGARRAPEVSATGWTREVVSKIQIPTLLVSPAHDKQVPPEAVRNLYEDIASQHKVLLDLACTSHNALWEKNHGLLFRASLEWLRSGSVQGNKEGVVRLGY